MLLLRLTQGPRMATCVIVRLGAVSLNVTASRAMSRVRRGRGETAEATRPGQKRRTTTTIARKRTPSRYSNPTVHTYHRESPRSSSARASSMVYASIPLDMTRETCAHTARRPQQPCTCLTERRLPRVTAPLISVIAAKRPPLIRPSRFEPSLGSLVRFDDRPGCKSHLLEP